MKGIAVENDFIKHNCHSYSGTTNCFNKRIVDAQTTK
jgi:hypothetical protein